MQTGKAKQRQANKCKDLHRQEKTGRAGEEGSIVESEGGPAPPEQCPSSGGVLVQPPVYFPGDQEQQIIQSIPRRL